ncbi:MAG TPA: hypothetical protein QF624_01285 [Dehalococcoidia bacterium]|nr:hypothetical protein [Dehalococcoidia bacterium]
MRSQSVKQHLITAALFAGGFSVLNIVLSDTSVRSAATSFPVFFAIMFLTMRATNVVTVALGNRFRTPPPEPLPPPEPTTERPDHAQRRRRRPRRRGRRSRRS